MPVPTQAIDVMWLMALVNLVVNTKTSSTCHHVENFSKSNCLEYFY